MVYSDTLRDVHPQPGKCHHEPGRDRDSGRRDRDFRNHGTAPAAVTAYVTEERPIGGVFHDEVPLGRSRPSRERFRSAPAPRPLTTSSPRSGWINAGLQITGDSSNTTYTHHGRLWHQLDDLAWPMRARQVP